MSSSASEIRLAGDKTVGRLVKWLRVLGISVETLTPKDPGDIPQGVVLLTRKQSWARWTPKVLILPSEKVEEQLRFVFKALPWLSSARRPFSRCLRCNAPLENIPREEVFGLVPDYVYDTQREFRRCPVCDQIYWPGSHRERMQRRLRKWGLLPKVSGKTN